MHIRSNGLEDFYEGENFCTEDIEKVILAEFSKSSVSNSFFYKELCNKYF